MIGVLIVDDHSLIREGLRSILSRETDIVVVGEAESGREAVKVHSELQPDVTVLDLRLPDMDGQQVITAIRFRDANANILVLSTYSTEMDVARCIAAGAKGYLQKGATRQELIDAIRRAASGMMSFSQETASRLAQGMTTATLTGREAEVLHQMAQGLSNEDISERLSISVPTVKGHLTHILSKMGVQNRTQALIEAMKRGLLSGPNA